MKAIDPLRGWCPKSGLLKLIPVFLHWGFMIHLHRLCFQLKRDEGELPRQIEFSSPLVMRTCGQVLALLCGSAFKLSPKLAWSPGKEGIKPLKWKHLVQQPLIDHFYLCYTVKVAVASFKGPGRFSQRRWEVGLMKENWLSGVQTVSLDRNKVCNGKLVFKRHHSKTPRPVGWWLINWWECRAEVCERWKIKASILCKLAVNASKCNG